MFVHGKTTKPEPPLIAEIERKTWLKRLGVTFQNDPCNRDLHIDSLLFKASSRMYIFRVCKWYGYSKDQLHRLFESLIMSQFKYGTEVWAAGYKGKTLDRIDGFIRRAARFGYVSDATPMSVILDKRDSGLSRNSLKTLFFSAERGKMPPTRIWNVIAVLSKVPVQEISSSLGLWTVFCL